MLKWLRKDKNKKADSTPKESSDKNAEQDISSQTNPDDGKKNDSAPKKPSLENAEKNTPSQVELDGDTKKNPSPSKDTETLEKPKKNIEKPKNQGGWLSRLVGGLSKSSTSIVSGIADVITKKKLDGDTLQDLEDILIMADIGPKNAMKFVANISKDRFDKEITDEDIRTALAQEIETVLSPVEAPLAPNPKNTPHVILVVGVNGSGKTTTIGKLAQKFTDQGQSVMLAAGDTFRAAAVEQLQVWGQRTGCTVITKDTGTDAAALAYESLVKAKESNTDVLIIDTAGRLHNKDNLMAELEKIVRVIKKHDENYPHDTVMVLDATIGQNTINQVTTFKDKAGVTGLIITKLDGTAKGGIVIQLADEFKLPVHAIGVGESVDDLQPFSASNYANSLMGVGHHKT